MFCILGKQDFTSYVPYESINAQLTAGDPVGKATFQVIDPGAQFLLTSLQEVVFIDETLQLGGVTLQPTSNYLSNNNFNYGNAAWKETGSTLTGRVTFPAINTFGSGAVATLSFSNQAIGTDAWHQAVSNAGAPATDYAVPGLQYCFSATINVTATFVNSYSFLQIVFLDDTGAPLGLVTSPNITSSSGAQIFSITATAPANTFQVQAAFGGTTTSTTNSGTATFTATQLEPMWFPALYSYPSPICDFLQANSITLPDGTSTRFDRIFCGYISHTTVSYEGTTRIWDIEATSLTGMLENATLINATYDNQTDQSIIVNLINNIPGLPLYAALPSMASGTPQALAYRNGGVVYAGVTVTDLEFADATPREVLNALSDITGFLFGVDHYYNPYYGPPFYNEAQYGFAGNGAQPDNVTTFPYYDYSIEYDASQIQNALNVSGNTYEKQITENFTAGDGTHSQVIIGGKMAGFNLTFMPAGSISIPQVKFGGTLQTIVVDTNIGFGSAQTMQMHGDGIGIASGVTFGTSVSVTYTYDALVYVQVQSPDSIGSLGRALYSKINDTNLTSNAQAITEGEAQLAAYANPRITLKFKTTKYLAPGQVIEFTSAFDSIIKGHFTVQKTTATYLGDGINQYEIEAGVYVDDFVDFFRNSQKAINRADHDPTAPIQQYNNLQMDSISYTDSLNIHT